MGLRTTWRPKLGPFTVNMGNAGPTSVTIRLGRTTVRLWSRTQGIHPTLSSIDLPGPISYRAPRGGHR